MAYRHSSAAPMGGGAGREINMILRPGFRFVPTKVDTPRPAAKPKDKKSFTALRLLPQVLDDGSGWEPPVYAPAEDGTPEDQLASTAIVRVVAIEPGYRGSHPGAVLPATVLKDNGAGELVAVDSPATVLSRRILARYKKIKDETYSVAGRDRYDKDIVGRCRDISYPSDAYVCQCLPLVVNGETIPPEAWPGALVMFDRSLGKLFLDGVTTKLVEYAHLEGFSTGMTACGDVFSPDEGRVVYIQHPEKTKYSLSSSRDPRPITDAEAALVRSWSDILIPEADITPEDIYAVLLESIGPMFVGFALAGTEWDYLVGSEERVAAESFSLEPVPDAAERYAAHAAQHIAPPPPEAMMHPAARPAAAPAAARPPAMARPAAQAAAAPPASAAAKVDFRTLALKEHMTAKPPTMAAAAAPAEGPARMPAAVPPAGARLPARMAPAPAAQPQEAPWSADDNPDLMPCAEPAQEMTPEQADAQALYDQALARLQAAGAKPRV